MIQKLPIYLFNCCHLQVFHLMKCDCLQFFSYILNQGFNMSICVNMKELSPSFNKLNALFKLNILKCSSFRKLLASIGQLNVLLKLNLLAFRVFELTRTTCIYWPIECTSRVDLSECSNLQKLPTSIDQLTAF